MGRQTGSFVSEYTPFLMYIEIGSAAIMNYMIMFCYVCDWKM